MLPPGLGFNAVSAKALAASTVGAAAARRTGTGSRCSRRTRDGFFPYTPATNLLYGLREALDMLLDEGPGERLRPPRSATREATRARRARRGGSRSSALDTGEYSSVADRRADARRARRRRVPPDRSSSASTCRSAPGSASLTGKVFRIGHLGDFNDLMLAGTLGRRRDGARRARASRSGRGGVQAALDHLAATGVPAAAGAAG